MKQTILVATNFSQSSRNALNYICHLADPGRYRLVLLHIFTIPVTYTAEGVALASIHNALQGIEEQLDEELDWVRRSFPDLIIESRALIGGFVESLEAQIRE